MTDDRQPIPLDIVGVRALHGFMLQVAKFEPNALTVLTATTQLFLTVLCAFASIRSTDEDDAILLGDLQRNIGGIADMLSTASSADSLDGFIKIIEGRCAASVQVYDQLMTGTKAN